MFSYTYRGYFMPNINILKDKNGAVRTIIWGDEKDLIEKVEFISNPAKTKTTFTLFWREDKKFAEVASSLSDLMVANGSDEKKHPFAEFSAAIGIPFSASLDPIDKHLFLDTIHAHDDRMQQHNAELIHPHWHIVFNHTRDSSQIQTILRFIDEFQHNIFNNKDTLKRLQLVRACAFVLDEKKHPLEKNSSGEFCYTIEECINAINASNNASLTIEAKNVGREAVEYVDKIPQISLLPSYETIQLALEEAKEESLPELFKKKKYDKIIENCNRALEENPHDYHAHYNLGRCLQEQKNYKSAISAFENALHINSINHKAYHNLGLCYEATGDYKNALVAFKEAARCIPISSIDYVKFQGEMKAKIQNCETHIPHKSSCGGLFSKTVLAATAIGVAVTAVATMALRQ
jgi:tetratricopeptide (TPR) repeat protein